MTTEPLLNIYRLCVEKKLDIESNSTFFFVTVILQDVIPLVHCPALNICNQQITKRRRRVLLTRPAESLCKSLAMVASWVDFLLAKCLSYSPNRGSLYIHTLVGNFGIYV